MQASRPTPSTVPIPAPTPRLGGLRALLQPAFFDFWGRHLSPTWSLQRPLARVVSITPASARAATLLLKPNRHWQGALPGQHVNLGVEVNGARLTRSYSLSAPRRLDGCIEITVSAVEGGTVSRHLVGAIRVGEVLEIGPGFGELTLPDRPADPWLLLAAGSGITPLMALIRQQAALGMPAALTLGYWARRADELCFADELRQLAERYPQFRVDFLLTAEGERPAARINAVQVHALAPEIEHCRVYACGSGGFVETAQALCSGARGFRAEGFSPAPNQYAESGTARVTLLRSGRTLEVPRDRPLLQALEQQGLNPAYGCRMGICQTCKCMRTSGASRDLQNGSVDAEPNTQLRICVSAAAGDLSLDL